MTTKTPTQQQTEETLKKIVRGEGVSVYDASRLRAACMFGPVDFYGFDISTEKLMDAIDKAFKGAQIVVKLPTLSAIVP